MSFIDQYINSGILEMYVLGETSPEESAEVEQMASEHSIVRDELDRIGLAMEGYAQAHAVEPCITIKPLILASIDYTERLKSGEPMTFPPSLQDGSVVEEYDEWLNRPDMVASTDYEEIFAKIIGYTPSELTAIVWLRNGSPAEVHDDEYEKFLVLEGACDIFVGDEVHHLVAGDYRRMPLHVSHEVKVTSDIPCKVILQREKVMTI